MTSFSIEKFAFEQGEIRDWGRRDRRHRNWPVVYVMNNSNDVYVGESLNAETRMRQHLEAEGKRHLTTVRVMLDETYNKSACLDLESYLIRMFSGDGQYRVLNSNAGITDANYFDREKYRKTFEQVFHVLKSREDLFQRTIPEIINSDLFKLSPFKALNHDQAIAVEDIVEGLFQDLESGARTTTVVQGNPGTGKTVVAIYLLKLLEDIRHHNGAETLESDSIFSDFFTPEHAELLRGLRVGMVVPQQSLRESISKVFRKTPGLDRRNVLTPFQVGESPEPFDVLIVDEAHRLNQRANQSAGPKNTAFANITARLFGDDDPEISQLDWIRKQSKHTILMLDVGQTVRPADLPDKVTRPLIQRAQRDGRLYALQSQMRVKAGSDYVGYVRSLVSDSRPVTVPDLGDYDFRFFDRFSDMYTAILAKNEEHGLSRVVAGYAWEWKTKRKENRHLFDIELDGLSLRWNSTDTDWINKPGSETEVGSIHTVQGYDLNYCGVIIGRDLRYNRSTNRIEFDRSHYFDKKGKENNPKRDIIYTDSDLLEYVRNIYSVLMTRGILGTYVHVVDPELRKRLRRHFPAGANGVTDLPL